MIDLRELRIGNFVCYRSDISGQEKEIEVEWTFFAEDFWPKHSHPIPLSPEWLERFGFKKRQGWGGNEFYFLHTGYVEFQWEEGGFLISVEDQNLLLDHIKTVHQFQNIYYSLTSEELELKQ